MANDPIKGLEGLEQALIALGGEVGGKVLRGAGMDAMKIVEAHQKENVPVSGAARTVKRKDGSRVVISPGFMKSRIRRRSQLRFTRRGTVRRGFKQGETLHVRAGVFRIPYIVQTEYGTSKQEANPFLRRSLHDNQTAVVEEFAARMRRRITNAAKRLAAKQKKKQK